jgi:nitronate monooxygenase
VCGSDPETGRSLSAGPEVVKVILNAHGEDTERSSVFDIARGVGWPTRYTGGTVRNEFLDKWRGREVDLISDAAAREDYKAEEMGDVRVVPVWAGGSIDLITESLSATHVVRLMASEPRICSAAFSMSREGSGSCQRDVDSVKSLTVGPLPCEAR